MSPAPSDSASQANSLHRGDSLHTKRKDSGASYGAVVMKTVSWFLNIWKFSDIFYLLSHNYLDHSAMFNHV